MPPRSYYLEPRATDYLAFAKAFFPGELAVASEFTAQTGLPYISGSEHIAAYVGVASTLVRQILHRPKYHYRNFSIDKIDGTKREISTPRTYLKVIQWWILDNVLRHGSVHPVNHGFFPGRSYVTNAQSHAGCRHLLNLDIKQFFPNIDFHKIKKVYENLGYGDAGSDTLALLTSLDGSAPTGAPTSPMIGNLVLYKLDVELSDIGCRYSRYADDITISSQDMIADEVRIRVEHLVEQHGFQINNKKTKFMGRGNRMEVTGLTINSGINLPAGWRNSARGFFHSVIQNPSDYLDEWSHISGLYGTLLAIDPEKNKKLTQAAEQALKKVTIPKAGT